MKKIVSIMVAIVMFSVSISCNKDKNNSKDGGKTIMDDLIGVTKEDGTSARIKVVDSILKVMKDESPYPKDMEVLSIKETDSISSPEISKRILEWQYPLKPHIIPEVKKRALDKSIVGYVISYKLRYRISDRNVVVKDYIIVLDAKDNTVMYSYNHNLSHIVIVHELAIRLERYLLNTIKA
jgi:hypothetical protein